MVEYVHERILTYAPCEIGIDMTMGNGFDTLALAKICEHVYSFDVQKEAISSTNEKLKDMSHVRLILDNHVNVDSYVQECDIAIFNLGYLPQFSHEITTILESTQCALKKIIKMIIVCKNHLQNKHHNYYKQTFFHFHKTTPKNSID